MACSVNIFDEILIGESTGGTLEFLFYDADQDGDADTGGCIMIPDAAGNVTVDGCTDGDYYFRYYGGEPPCDAEVIFFIRVVDQPDAGAGMTVDLCTEDDPVNVFSLVLGAPDLTGSWSGSAVDSDGWIDNVDPTLVEFDPSLVPVGVYEATYTVDVEPQEGFEIADCENCAPQTTTVTFNVIECTEPIPCNTGGSASTSICSTAGCTFDLFDILTGSPTSGGQWSWLSGAAVILPSGSQGTVNFANAPVGVYQFSYDLMNLDPSCTNVSIVTVQVVAQPWAGTDGTRALCESAGSTNLFTSLGGNPNTGGTWTISPLLPNGTFFSNGFINPAVGDAGTYVATYTVCTPVSGACGSVCCDSSTVTVTIAANCTANNGTLTLCQDDTVTLNAATLLGGSTTGGTWGVAGISANCNNNYTQPVIFSVNGAPATNHFGESLASGSVLSNFASLGCYLFIYTCTVPPPNQLCGDQGEFVLQIIDCNPSCASAVVIEATGCNLSIDSLTNCPTPIYQWQVFTGGVWVAAPAPNNLTTYTGINGQQYRLRVTGCPNCPAIFSNVITVSCPPPPSCTISCTLTYNVTLQRFEAVITNSGSGSCSVPYQFNKYVNNNANCLFCTGVNIPTCSGNVVVPSMNSVTVACNTAQTAVEECWRFVTLASCCNQTLCCAKKPAAAALVSYKLTFPLLTGYTAITIAGTTYTFGSTSPFNCNEYESTQPSGTMTGVVNCSMAQFVIDLKQKMVALGIAGDVSLWQGSKSSELRIKDTDVVFNSMTRNGGITDPFTIITTVLCDTVTSWHFQGLTSVDNFPSTVGIGGYLDPSVGGTLALFPLLDLYFGGSPVELPHTGTFTAAVCGSTTSGCVDINTTCCAGGAPPVTVHPTTGVVTWVAFVPTLNPCHWHFRYLVTMPNGCQECVFMALHFEL